MEDKRTNTNLWWSIGILTTMLAITIGLYISDYMICYEKFINQLSLISTILSIILSIFAIFYSYHSMVESQRQWSDISCAIEAIKENSRHTERAVESLQQQISGSQSRQNISATNTNIKLASNTSLVDNNNKSTNSELTNVTNGGAEISHNL